MKQATARSGRISWRAVPGVLLLVLASTAPAVPYGFANIADTSGPFAEFVGGDVALNAGGTVAFTASGQGIFTGNGGPVTTVRDTSGPFSGFGTGIAINNGGTVAFMGTLDAGGSGIFSVGGGQATIAQTGGTFNAFSSALDMNSGGTVAFLGRLTGGVGVFSGNGGAVTPVFTTLGTGITGLGRPSINDNGTVAFLALSDGGTPDPAAAADNSAIVYRWSGGMLTIVAQASGLDTLHSVSINEDGTIAFVASNNGGTPLDPKDDTGTLYKWKDGSLAPVVDATGKFAGFGGVSIGTDGTVLFLGSLDTGGFGYYTSKDLVNPVISRGDTLFGLTVTGLDSQPGFNDAGQIAFTYESTGTPPGGTRIDRRGVALASPLAAVGIPAPATLALFGLGLAGLGCARQARARRRAAPGPTAHVAGLA